MEQKGKVESMRNLKVKLKDQATSLTCPFTGWSITRSQEKKTPKVYSKRITEWIKNGALIPLESIAEIGNSITELLAEPTKGKTKAQLVEMAKLINAAEGEDVVEYEEINKADIVESVQRWKDEKEDVGEGKGGDEG